MIEKAITEYRKDTGDYPPTFTDGHYDYSREMNHPKKYGSRSLYLELVAKGYGDINEDYLYKYGPGPDEYVIVDGWGNEILYLNSEDYGDAKRPDSGPQFKDPGVLDLKYGGRKTQLALTTVGEKFRKAGKYQIRSMGSNLYDDRGLKDDVQNFGR